MTCTPYMQIYRKIGRACKGLPKACKGLSITLHYDTEIKKPHSYPYELPDGTVVDPGVAAFQCVEDVLFNPSMSSGPSMHALTSEAIMMSGWSSCKPLYDNIVLAGGNTMLRGFPQRLHKELAQIAGRDIKVSVVELDDRQNVAWLGGSVVASQSRFQDMCHSKQEYEDWGVALFARK